MWTRHYPSDLSSSQYSGLLAIVKTIDNNVANEFKLLLFQATTARNKNAPPRVLTSNPGSPLRGAGGDHDHNSGRATNFSQSLTKKVQTLSRREKPSKKPEEGDGGKSHHSKSSKKEGGGGGGGTGSSEGSKKKKKRPLSQQFSAGELVMNTVRVMNYKPYVLAEGLSQIEAELFRSVQPREFIEQRWQKDDKEKHAANLVKFINRFNEVRSPLYAPSHLLFLVLFFLLLSFLSLFTFFPFKGMSLPINLFIF